MSLREDILKLLKNEGYRITDVIDEAVDEFLDLVEEEAEDDDLNFDEDEDVEDGE